MATISIRVHDHTKERLRRMAKAVGASQSAIAREAIHDKMEELEDLVVAKGRLAKPFRAISNEDVWKDLGITE